MSEEQLSSELSQGGKQRTGRCFLSGIIAGMLGTILIVSICFKAAHLQIVNLGSGDESCINEQSVTKLEALEQTINEKFYQSDKITVQQKQDGIYKGLLESLDDPYSVYYTADELKALNESIEGSYYGIGAYMAVDQDTGLPKIAGVIAGTPSEEAGLEANDLIVQVDGESTEGLSLDEVVSRVRGEEGTTVHLTLVRSGESDYVEVDIERRKVDSPTVSSNVLENDIGYLAIAEFDDVTTDQFKKHLDELYAQNIKGLIIDVRDNPGGNVDVVTAIANEIIPKGLVFYMEDKNGKKTEYKADGRHQIRIPLVILVNGNSASASEILTGAIQDSGCGDVVGTQTFGKGIVQTVYQFRDGTAAKITVANYYTRDGNDINKVGITPDVIEEFDIDEYKKNGTDTQLEKALEILKEKIK